MWELLSALNDALTVHSDRVVLAAWLQFLPMIGSALGSIFGKSAGSKSDQRQQENMALAQQNRTLADLYGTQQAAQFAQGNQDLARKQFSEQARGGRTKQAVIGDILGRLQDVNVSVPGIKTAQVTGGLRPSAMGETSKAASAELAKQALLKLMGGDTFEGGNLLPAPQLAGMQQPSGLEKFLNIAGLVGSGIGGIGGALQGLNEPATYVPRPLEPQGRDILGGLR